MADGRASPPRRDEGLCPWDLAAPDENGHVELQYECGDQQVGINLGHKADVLDRFKAYIKRHEWRA